MAVTKLSNSGIATGGVLKYDSMLAGNAAFEPSNYEHVATITSNGSTAQFIFSSIPQTYRYLEIRGYGTSTGVGAYRNIAMRMNGVATSAYRYRWVVSNNNSMSANASAGSTEMPILQSWPYASGDNAGVGLWVISNYTSTSIAKTVICWGGGSQSSGTEGELSYAIGTFASTNAVNEIMMFNVSANAWTSGTEFSLYGVK